MSTDWLGARLPLYERLSATTAAPCCDQVAPQFWRTRWLPGNVNVSRQPVHAAEPVLVMRIRAVKPELHVVVVYATRQAKPGPPVVGVVNVTVPDRGDTLPAASRA